MKLPANWQPQPAPVPPARMVTRFILPILFCALGGAIWTLFALLVGTKVLHPPAVIFSKASNPETRFFGLVAGPYLVSIALLLVPSRYTRSFACGASSAAAVVLIYWEGLFFALLLIALLFEGSPSMRGSDPPSGPFATLVLLSLICHALVIYSSVILCGFQLRGIPVAIAGALLGFWYAGYVYSAQQTALAKYTANVEAIEKESTTAFEAVESISWCAIAYAGIHGGQEYPPNLEVIAGNPICRRPWSGSAIPHYTVTYNLTATGFTVKATAPWTDQVAPRNASSNETGVALVEYQDPKYNAYPAEIRTGSPLGDIFSIHGWLRDYASDHPQIGYPDALTDVPNVTNLFRQHGMSQFLTGSVIRSGGSLFSYAVEAASEGAKHNSYRVRCPVRELRRHLPA